MWFKRLFKKKEKKVELPKMDLSKYKLKITIKAICMFEKLTGKSFYDFVGDDVLTLMYCAFKCSNNIDLKLSTFYILLEDERISKWIMKKANDMFDVLQQYPSPHSEETEEKGEDEDKKLTITDIANTLIIDYGMGADWVMNDMELWQIEDLYKIAEEKVKNRYSEERLWTYLTILPHVDGKKLDSPEKLMPFPWEENKKKESFETEAKRAAAFFKSQAEKENEG